MCLRCTISFEEVYCVMLLVSQRIVCILVPSLNSEPYGRDNDFIGTRRTKLEV